MPALREQVLLLMVKTNIYLPPDFREVEYANDDYGNVLHCWKMFLENLSTIHLE